MNSPQQKPRHPGHGGPSDVLHARRLRDPVRRDDPLEAEADHAANMTRHGRGSPLAYASSAVRVAGEPGAPLPGGVRREYESRFGHDFSRVRVHSDDKAAGAARAIEARAYTVGSHIAFGRGEYAPAMPAGKQLLAHELTHVVQQDSGKAVRGVIQRVPARPTKSNSDKVPFDRSKVDVPAIPDLVAKSPLIGPMALGPQTATVTFNDPAITHLVWEFYDPSDTMIDGFGTMSGGPKATSETFVIQNNDPARKQWTVVQGRYTMRCIGYDNSNEPVAYADRTFYVWTSTPTGKPPDIAALEAEKTTLEATTKSGSGKSFGEVGSAFAKLKDVTHDLSILQTGTGTYVGTQCSTAAAGTTPTNCTNIVLEVLENTFTQQGKSADWAKVKKKWAENTKARGGGGMSGLDVQAALQSEAGWKGIFWAPDPSYQVPAAELDKGRPDEASYTAAIAKKKGTYYKDFGKKGYPGVSISQSVTNYAPETPTPGSGTASTTTKDVTQLNKLKKLPFGVLAAHGGEHMTIITYGKVIEVHWAKEATDADLIEQTDLEKWAVGPRSGYHYYASGAIVAPAADVDAAFA